MKTEYMLSEFRKLKTPDISYIDVVMEFADREGYELEILADIIRRSPTLKAVISEDAEALNMIEKSNRIPDDLFD